MIPYIVVVINITLAFTVIVISYLIIERFEKNKNTGKILLGILFGVGAVTSMMFPVKILPGVILDSRGIFVNLSALLFGRTAGFISMFMATTYRLYIGGEGVIPGTLLIFIAFISGVLFYLDLKTKRKKISSTYVFLSSFIVQSSMLILAFLFFKHSSKFYSIIKITSIMLIVYPFFSIFLATLIQKFEEDKIKFKETEKAKTLAGSLLDNIIECVITFDSNLKITYSNKVADNLLKTELKDKNLSDILEIKDNLGKEVLKEIIEFSKNLPLKLNNCIIKKGTKQIEIEGVITHLSENNKDREYLLTFRDIGEEKQRKQLFKEVLERISDGIESYDNNWNYTFVNKQAANMLNKKSPEDLIGKNKWKLEPEAIGSPFYKACLKAKKTQKPVFIEHYFEPWKKWFENRIYPSKDGITVFFSDITEKKNLETKIMELNHNLETILSLSPAIIFLYNPDTRETLFVSKNIETILGYPVEETYQYKWWRKNIYPEDSEKAVSNSDFVYINDSSTQTFRFFKSDGTIAWILEKQIMVRDKQGKPEVIYGTWLDITHLVETEKLLEESEKRFSKMFHNKMVPMILFERENGEITDVNEATTNLYGYPKEDFLHKFKLKDFCDDSKHLKSPKKKERLHKKSNGDEIFVEIHPIIFSFKEKNYLLTIIHDITKEKEIERELIESEEKFHLAFETVPVPFSITKLDTGEIIEVNDAFAKISGYKKEELIGKSTLELQFWEQLKDREKFIKLVKEKKIIKDMQMTFLNKYGKQIYVLFSARILKSEKLKANLLVASLVDITQLLELQKELETRVRERTRMYEDLNEELKESTLSIAHDLKEPVRTLKNYSEILLNILKNRVDEEALRYLDYINFASSNIESLIENLLEYSTLGKKKITFGRIPLDSLIKKIIRLLEKKINETDTKIEIFGDLPVVYGNEQLLFKVFYNLIENSIKFRDKNKKNTIEIWSEEKEGNATVFIKDNGIGIKEEDIKTIFFPFKKIHNDRSIEGKGMGLAIVKRSLEVLGGRIEVNSIPQKGSLFKITLKK